MNAPPVLVTGATGYVGGRLVPRLLEAGHQVRCLVRQPRKLSSRPWSMDARVSVVAGELSDLDSVVAAMSSCGAAYYLVHGLTSAADADRDQRLAAVFAAAAERAGLERIIYLGGLADTAEGALPRLAGRQAVARALASGTVPVTTLRAAMIIGSGSASFEILRHLVERLPIMVTPKWVSRQCQPIAVRNVLSYLVACLSTPATIGQTLEIGGPDVVSYRELMQAMAKALRLRPRLVVPVPVLTPRLSALWIHLVTPIGHRAALPVVEELRNTPLCRSSEARRLMPQRLLPVDEAIQLALTRMEERNVQTAWSSAGPIPGDPDWSGGTVLTHSRSIELDAPPAAVYRALCRIGGRNGWYAAGWLWRIRGFIDRLVGGPGLRRGRRDPEQLAFGDALDFWRVIALEPNRLLRLRAEMRLPGEAVLEFEIEPLGPAGELPTEPGEFRAPRSRVTQTARFRPHGLAGLVYWYGVAPLHGIVFPRMLDGIAAAATQFALASEHQES